MAAEERGAVSGAPVCLCVLCGLPAAGKSSLSLRVLRTAEQRGWRVGLLRYDDLIPDQAFESRGVEEDGVALTDVHTEWKSHRLAVLQCIDQFLEKPGGLTDQLISCKINRTAWEQSIINLQQPEGLDQTPLLFLLDDNFYYPSMRYEVHQLARKHSLGFCQLYLQCDLESCISRNQKRSKPIPTEVIVEMEKRLEPPNPLKNPWEKSSISINTDQELSDSDVQKVMELISSSMNNPLSPLEDHTEQTEADRLKCATSVVHQADQACRRLVSDTMKKARENQVPPEHMKRLAAQLNESKSSFLHHLRGQMLQEGAFLQDEDVDVDQVVKRAMDVFDQERREILSKIMNGKRRLES